MKRNKTIVMVETPPSTTRCDGNKDDEDENDPFIVDVPGGVWIACDFVFSS